MWKWFTPLVFILAVSCAVRFVYLDKVPNAISGDELVYITTAKAVALTGSDITGTWNPLSALLFRYPKGEHQAELSYFIHLPFSGIFPLSLFIARIPFAIFSVGIVYLLYLLTKRFVGSNEAIFVGLVAAFNPWLVYIGRTSYESTPAAFFYLLGFYLLTSKNSRMIFLSIPVFLAAFYSYIGLKLVFLPLVLLYTIWAAKSDRKHISLYILVAVSALIVITFFSVSTLRDSSGSRMGELLLPNSIELAQEVDHQRKISIQSPIAELFINKVTVYLRLLVTRMFRIFSPTYLFLEGDEFYSIWRHGFFYAQDIVFFCIGAMVLFWKKRNVFLLFSISILLGASVHIFNTTEGDFCYHIAFMFLFFIMYIGIGISWVLAQLKTSKTKILGTLILSCIYVFTIGNFFYIYFFQHPLGGYFDFPLRVLSRYIAISKQTHVPIIVQSNAYADFFKKYMFYTDGLTTKTIRDIRNTDMTIPFIFDTIKFTECDEINPNENATSIIIRNTDCGPLPDQPHVSISALSDAGERFRIYHDVICSNYPLKRYPSNITHDLFAIETLSVSRFCEAYINRL